MPTVQVAKAGERAKKDDKRILLMFGGDWCGWCHKLHDLFKTNREIATDPVQRICARDDRSRVAQRR